MAQLPLSFSSVTQIFSFICYFLTIGCATPKPHAFEEYLFGTRVDVEAKSLKFAKGLKKEIIQLKTSFTQAMDPDCIWRKKNQGHCENAEADKTAELESLAQKFNKETLGAFNIKKNKHSKRDFSGLSQGYFIDQIKKERFVIIDFSGDIFFSGGFTPSKKIVIGEPFLSVIPFAEVNLKSGWMITSGSKKLGANIYRPENATANENNFLQVTLFAQASFSGARLDAWTTAIASGGRKVLNHLWDLQEFKGQWAYFYFDSQGFPYCSKNLICDLEKLRQITPVLNSTP